MQLKDKTVVITGAASGIGAAAAVRFAEQGARLVLADMNPMNATLERVSALQAQACTVQGDLQDAAECRRIVETAEAEFGSLDVLVNNAGFGVGGGVETVDEEALDKVWAVNFRAPLRLCRAALPVMRRQGGGVVLFTTALAGMYGMPNALAYSTSKAAVINMAKALAVEHGHDGIRSNCVSPGPVRTPMLQGAIEVYGLREEMFAAMAPNGRIAEAEDVADALVFLASPAARSINGHVLVVDNGIYAGQVLPKQR
jgi:NAD(P)-dependent dehydrogenase (short-subunit alcohol dehydrogenase family)